jgi:hypothetical protein
LLSLFRFDCCWLGVVCEFLTVLFSPKPFEFCKIFSSGLLFLEKLSDDGVSKVEKFKNRGAISGCIYVTDYDVYHK